MGNFKKLAQKRLFLPVFSMILVMLINVVYDIATGSAPLSFFMISIKNGVLYGRLIDILNRGSEIAILAIGMTLVVSASGGTDISVGSVMSLYAGVCCMILAGYGNVNVQEYAHPLLVGIGAGLLVTLICGVFNGFLVAYMNIQPMVATLILWSAGRAVGLLLCNSQIVYVRVPSFQKLGAYCGIIPTPIIVAAVCVAIASIVLRYTALGTYIQSVGINKKASRIAGFNSAKIILMCYAIAMQKIILWSAGRAICGRFVQVLQAYGIIATSRIYSLHSRYQSVGINKKTSALILITYVLCNLRSLCRSCRYGCNLQNLFSRYQ